MFLFSKLLLGSITSCSVGGGCIEWFPSKDYRIETVGVGYGKTIVEKVIVHVPEGHGQHQQWEAKCRVCTFSEMWWDSIWLLQYLPSNHYQSNQDNNVQQIVIEVHHVAFLTRPVKSLKVIENKASLRNIQGYRQLKEARWLSAIWYSRRDSGT